MMPNAQTPPGAKRRGRLVGAGVVAAALAIAGGFYLSNGAARATDCAAQPERAALIADAARGQLAALNGTGGGRGYAALAFEDGNGSPKTIGDFAGKALLVNFWATWCVPCRAEMPALDALAGRFNGASFAVLAINVDLGSEGPAKARAFLEEGGWANLPLYADPTFTAFKSLQTAAVASGLPTTLVLDEEGCELAVLQGPAEWDSPDGAAVVEALIAS